MLAGTVTDRAPPVTARASPRAQRRAFVAAYATPNDLTALVQVATTLGPIALLWVVVAWPTTASAATTVAATVAMSLFLLRGFVLMHDCGHQSLFRSPSLNRAVGFVLGVMSGMPQYVWSKHHAYHHATNGDWERYRGPLNIITVDAYEALSARDRRRYRAARRLAYAPLMGLLYLIVNPRRTWLVGTWRLAGHVLRGKLASPDTSLAQLVASFETTLWSTPREYRHMTANNLAVLLAWTAMSFAVGPALFFGVYLGAVALAGGAALVLFTVQHNFEGSYASGTAGWDADEAVLHGTSMLVLPRWLNWFTADIAYHHVHHLSAGIPNYRLAECHVAGAALFTEVTRLRLAQIPAAVRCILWDTRARRIVPVPGPSAA
jgi:omega-6 fatty acid desaturase (delta-12 desaturase)